MTTLIESKASRQIYSDGKLVDDMGINATFDGNILDNHFLFIQELFSSLLFRHHKYKKEVDF